ncbi:DUF1631 family protein [Verminephrobacter aporrectodeae]|uniref:DUF1631 family protein n=1 Tax=Verminephrobacter aporrectodeae TaxID=1110389 RepID=UPI0002375B0B|nr:DUF1631 family protein [Verminephrobacter aporrectodeae]
MSAFQACIADAMRASDALVRELLRVAQEVLAADAPQNRDIRQRDLLDDSLRLLNRHEAALVGGYPRALAEICAQNPSGAKNRTAVEDSAPDLDELSLVGEDVIQAQVEFSKARQSVLRATDEELSELDTLISSAQGLHSVQPERNPLRPENYIRALQQVVDATGVSGEVRQIWIQQMCPPLGRLLAEEYQKVARSLSQQGVQPVSYMLIATPSDSVRGGAGGGHPVPGPGSPGRGPGQAAAAAEEALLSLDIPHPLFTNDGSVPAVPPVAAAASPQPGPAGDPLDLALETMEGVAPTGQLEQPHLVEVKVEEAAPAASAKPAPDPLAGFVVGAWVEIMTHGRMVRTQLTWASAQATLFLFTAPDASTQSMTRRMRDKLAAQGALRVLPAAPPSPPAARQTSAHGRS